MTDKTVYTGKKVAPDKRAQFRRERREKMEQKMRGKRIVQNIRNGNLYDALSLVFDNQCAITMIDDDWYVFEIELHCEGTVRIVAKKIKDKWVVRSSTFIPEEG